MISDITSVPTSPLVSTPTSASSASVTAVKTPAVAGSGQALPSAVQAPATGNSNLEQKVKQLNEYAQSINREVQFSIDQESGRTVVKVIDSRTNEVITQFPSKEILTLDHALGNGNGLVIRAKA